MSGKPPARELTPEDKALIESHLRRHPPDPAKDQETRDARRRRGSLRKRVQRGGVEVDLVVDLHGLTADQAWERVMRAVRRARREHLELLKVITGKGLHASEDRPGVLAREIPARLRLDERVVEVIQGVRARDGGSGVWFVRIRG
ncbi:MAG: hypothetical protein D6761_03660 [Candidatus Dadabacteria bacterium]|nr:MAG: hypothetical protein D6761_03660 [Candidatus Dadabacteria bacterium]